MDGLINSARQNLWTIVNAADTNSVARADLQITSADDLSLFVLQFGTRETPIIVEALRP